MDFVVDTSRVIASTLAIADGNRRNRKQNSLSEQELSILFAQFELQA
jgi:hypothetical protein